ncbi:MAG TPA: AAA family ATPase [Rhodothermales bacterium]|nr:AAA family ATPase [Rhodothermales bacterium]
MPPDNYPVYVKTGTFAVRQHGRQALQDMRPGDIVFAYLSGVQVIAGMFEVVSQTFEDTTPLVAGRHYPHRIRVRTLVALSEEDRVPYAAFEDRLNVAEEYDSFRAVVQRVIHPLPKVDEKVLEFLVRARQAADFDKVLVALDAYRQARAAEETPEPPLVREEPIPYSPPPSFDRVDALEAVIAWIEGQGFVYEPWQVAAYVTALRTKPFVILAGVTGTGKSKLPALVEAATGGHAHLIPVHPDWTDSADVLGYVDLQGRFRPGAVLRAAEAAQENPETHHTALIDEMNLARVEQYFAEVLSRIEDRRPALTGGFESLPLLNLSLTDADAAWGTIALPANFALVGTVNMDESAHSFSRKVLDRAFTLELADVHLTARPGTDETTMPTAWPVAAWYPRAIRLAGLSDLTDEEQAAVDRAIEVLDTLNGLLAPAQAQVAYRTRDEVALFVLHALEVADTFRTRTGDTVDPLDLALHMKVLPRLQGGHRALRFAVLGLLGWATTGAAFREEEDARAVIDAWEAAGRATVLPEAAYPRTAARLCLMWERLRMEGFTSFWV